MKELNRQIYRFDNFQLDAGNRQLRRDDKPLSLSPKAFDLLLTLVENKGRLVEKDELYTSVWRDQIVEESNLPVHISQIRKALGETKNKPRFIETVPGYGYRFIGELQDFADNELIIETETLSRITIEKEEISDAEILESGKPGVDKKEAVRKNRFRKYAAGAILICLTLAFGVYFLNAKKSDVPFEKIKFTRLTNNGKVSAATLSSDGKFIAYVLGEAEGNSIWVRQVGAANDTRIVPPVKAQVYELTFTPDGSQIYYNLFTDGKADLELYRISSLGGVSERIPNVIASYIAFAPDGKRFAYAQSDSVAGQNYLVVADADGTNQQTILSKNHPNTFETQVPVVAWSPDGETIACLVNHFETDASYSSIVGINIRDGSEKLLSEQRWYDVFSIEWLNNGSGLLISGNDKITGNNQIWFLSYPNGAARQITNDLSQYDSLSAAADGKSFLTVQTNTVSSISVGETDADADDFREIVSETGALSPFVWTADGKIVFRSTADGQSNLWTMDADGGNRRQLTINAQVDSRGLCISPDGRYFVFASWRSGKTNLWRVDADGKNLTQLTDGEADTRPQCSPDGQSVVYQKGLHSKPRLWKLNLEGGEPVQLTDFYAKWNAISNHNRRISYFFMENGKWRIGIISSEGGSILQRLDVPASLKESDIRWSSDDRSLFYIGAIGNVGNVWNLPLDGGESKPVTNFKSNYLEDFAWSPDGKQLAVSRSTNLSDVILIERAK